MSNLRPLCGYRRQRKEEVKRPVTWVINSHRIGLKRGWRECDTQCATKRPKVCCALRQSICLRHQYWVHYLMIPWIYKSRQTTTLTISRLLFHHTRPSFIAQLSHHFCITCN